MVRDVPYPHILCSQSSPPFPFLSLSFFPLLFCRPVSSLFFLVSPFFLSFPPAKRTPNSAVGPVLRSACNSHSWMPDERTFLCSLIPGNVSGVDDFDSFCRNKNSQMSKENRSAYTSCSKLCFKILPI